VQVAARHSGRGAVRGPQRLVLLAPFLSLAETAARIYWYLPVRHFVRDVYDSARHLTGYAGTVAILAAGQDEVLGADQARSLAELARTRGETIYLELREARHERSSMRLSETQLTELLGAAALPHGG
jgi:hypothetical protein